MIGWTVIIALVIYVLIREFDYLGLIEFQRNAILDQNEFHFNATEQVTLMGLLTADADAILINMRK